MKAALTRFALGILLRKCVPDQMPLGCEASLQNDYYSLRVSGIRGQPEGERYLLKAITGDALPATSWDGRTLRQHIFTVHQLLSVSWEIHHYYKHWSISLGSVCVAVLHELLPIHALKWRRFAWRHARLSVIRDRYLVLEHLLALRSPLSREGVAFEALLDAQYGQAAMTSPRQNDLIDATMLVLGSLKDSGEVSYEGYSLGARIQINPKALVTLCDYQLAAERFNSTLRIQRGQVWVGIGLIIVGAATAFATLWDLIGGHRR
jgi:hypothetical protein